MLKNKITFYFITVLLFFVSCISTNRVKLTDCNNPSGWCKEIRDIAKKSWKYAQLCKNVYQKPFQYDISEYFDKIGDYENSKINFFSSLYRDKTTKEYILVFRGTDSFVDFKTGNNPFRDRQNQFALALYDKLKDSLGFPKCIVAGHSLGGGISIHISLNRKSIVAYSFNGSPVFKNKENIENERYSIVENGEILKLLRLFGREATQLYTSIGCSKGDPINQHDMMNLANCLTKIAAYEDAEAASSLKRNGIK